MYTTISTPIQFRELFTQANRHDHLSYDGYRVLFDYLEECFDGEYEADAIELCCTFDEHNSLADYYAKYSNATEEKCDDHIVGFTNHGSVVAHQW